MKRLAIILLVIVIILVIFTLVLRTCDRGTDIPVTNDARYKITADNRIYYTDSYSQGTDRYGQYIILNGYWSLVKTVWKYNKSDFYLSYRGYADVKIEDR
jgi:hypothetical protein